VETVWEALQPFLIQKKQDIDKEWTDMLEFPPPPL